MPVTRHAPEAPADPRNAPAYPIAEAARYLRLPVATLRSWVVGRGEHGTHNAGVIRPASRNPAVLSFWNLIEGHVLRALRTDHGVSLHAVRNAVKYAEAELGIDRLLLSSQLRTNAGQVFLDEYGKLTSLSASGQLVLRKLLESHLQRVEWDKWQFPVRLFPFLHGAESTTARPIVIDPSLGFGRPLLSRRGISTAIIRERLDAGESVAELAHDYDLQTEEIEQAVIYEGAA